MREPIVPAVPAARWKARTLGMDLGSVKGSGPGGVILLRDLPDLGSKSPSGLPRISPVARRLAEALGVPWESLAQARSANKRITLEDVIQAAGGLVAGGQRAQEALIQPRVVPMDSMRKAVARRMTQSAQTAPHIHLFCEMEMERLEQVKQELLPLIQDKEGVRLSINDLIIKATALTLKEFPLLNARLDGEQILVAQEINVGLAVAVGQGLIVPAISRADRLGLGRIAKLRSELVDRARRGTLKLEELERGTFTISSLARYPILFFTAILNPPQSGLLTVGRTREELTLREGRLILRKVAKMGLSADHRIVDGATGAEFLQALKARLERPASFLAQLE